MTDRARLTTILDLEPVTADVFRGFSPQTTMDFKRVFGGQVIAQALAAAGRTVEGRAPHSLHCYFILAGDPTIPIVYEVARLNDGRSFATRRITAQQNDQVIFSMIASFHADEEGAFDHQAAMPDVPGPNEIQPFDLKAPGGEKLLREMPNVIRRFYESERPVELRAVQFRRYLGEKVPDGQVQLWVRATETLSGDPLQHQCALAYISDFALIDSALARYGRTVFENRIIAASLDHAMWFHRPFRADEWLLYSQESPNARDGLGLARGMFFKQDGTLVASVAQEGSIRERREKPAAT
ncbi:MAG: acyl-CoA thioesterase II [Xanthobacteraceae bacterium]|nr:acyl-CoA thioesterase II [Xanthobacteraceae bacterium]